MLTLQGLSVLCPISAPPSPIVWAFVTSAHVLVCVVWTDAHGNAFNVYEPHEVPHAPAVVRTYGILIRRDDAGITLANEVFEAGSFRGVTFIPAGMITAVEEFCAVKPKRVRKAPTSAEVVPRHTP